MSNTFLPEGLHKARPFPIDIAYVVLNPKLPRDEYVQQCLKNNAVDLLFTDGTYYDQCLLASSTLSAQDGERRTPKFPDKVGELGSAVVVAFAHTSQKPIVIGFLPTFETFNVLENEDQAKSLHTHEDNTISLVKDPKQGKLLVSVKSDTENMAEFNTSVVAPEESGLWFLHVLGTVRFFGSKLVQLLAKNEFVLLVRDLVKQDKFTTIQAKLGEKVEVLDEFDNHITLDANGVTIDTPAEFNVTVKDNTNVVVEGKTNITVKSKCIITVQDDASIVVKGDASVNVDGDAKMVAKGAVTVDGKKIDIGNAANWALNTDCICQYSGNPHIKPATNTKTKV
jgi:hypothetical protein